MDQECEKMWKVKTGQLWRLMKVRSEYGSLQLLGLKGKENVKSWVKIVNLTKTTKAGGWMLLFNSLRMCQM